MVECDLAKVEVAGSNPVSRSIFTPLLHTATLTYAGSPLKVTSQGVDSPPHIDFEPTERLCPFRANCRRELGEATVVSRIGARPGCYHPVTTAALGLIHGHIRAPEQ